MLDKAREKLSDEMALKHTEPYIQVIGQFLLDQLEVNPAAAEKIMAQDKTIAKSIDTVTSEARKKAKNGMAMLTDQEVGTIVLKYYGIDGQVLPMMEPSQTTVPTSRPASSEFDVRLEDLL